MKLLMFTPTNINVSVTKIVHQLTTQLLALGHEVTIVDTQLKGLFVKLSTFPCEQAHWTNKEHVQTLIHSADMLIYHIDNNAKLYQGSVFWLSRHPGIVCLYSNTLNHLFRRWQPKWVNHMKSDVLHWICHLAYGVLVYVDFDITAITQVCGGPIAMMRLAIDKKKILDSSDWMLTVENCAEQVVAFCQRVACGMPMLDACRYFTCMLFKDWQSDLTMISMTHLMEPLKLLEKTTFPEGKHYFKS